MAKPKSASAKPSSTTAAGRVDRFTGFPADALAFLADLDENNERPWFEDQRARYEASVRGPAFAFITAMAQELPRISKHFVADPRPVGGSLMRIHRDVRFSADKRPYKTNIGIQFRHAAGKDVHAPGIYLHVEPTRCFLGAGLWHPEPDVLAAIRQRIVAKPAAWKTATTGAGFRKHWKLEGESLARPPKGFDAEHEHIVDLKRKDHIAVTTITTAAIGRADLPRKLADQLEHTKELLRFLCAAAGQPF